jgi:hypothetical protein
MADPDIWLQIKGKCVWPTVSSYFINYSLVLSVYPWERRFYTWNKLIQRRWQRRSERSTRNSETLTEEKWEKHTELWVENQSFIYLIWNIATWEVSPLFFFSKTIIFFASVTNVCKPDKSWGGLTFVAFCLLPSVCSLLFVAFRL